MANRLLPFRQYNEHFVINLFSLDLTSATLADFKHDSASSGSHDAGLLVKVSDAGSDIGAGYSDDGKGSDILNAYMGKTDYPHVARNVNPEAFAKFTIANGTDTILGVTLNQTLAFDENGEKMLYYRQKLLEHQGVLPGEVVPVLTKGIITVAESAVLTTAAPTAGAAVYAAADGKFRAHDGSIDGSFTNTRVGTCLAVGTRDGGIYDGTNNPDYFAGDGSTGSGTGGYYIINLDL